MHDLMLPDAPYALDVIGEHRLDPFQLLVLCEDGNFYALDLRDGHCEPTELTALWVVDACDLFDPESRARLN
jgi:hypothetical protein